MEYAVPAVPAVALLAEAFAAALMFAHGQPWRAGGSRRLLAVGAAYLLVGVAIMLAMTWWMPALVPSWDASLRAGPLMSVNAVAFCGAVLLSTIPALGCCLALDLPACAFCAACGYALQNFASGAGELVAALAGIGFDHELAYTLYTASFCAAVYAPAYLLLARRVDPVALQDAHGPALKAMTLVTIFMVIGFDVALKSPGVMALPIGTYALLRVMHGAVCALILAVNVVLVVNGRLAVEKAAGERLLAEHERQYELGRQSVKAIDARVHDIRHEIARMLAESDAPVGKDLLASVVGAVSIYDARVRTGNDALDVVLTEQGLVCSRLGITLTCVADGPALAFMDVADLYALFQSLLGRAIATVRPAPEEERSISLNVRGRAGMALIHLEHYRCGSDPAVPEDAAALVARYGGMAQAFATGRAIAIDVMLPQAPGRR